MRQFTIPSDGQKNICGVGSVRYRPSHLTVIPRKQSLAHENAIHLISGNDLCIGRPDPWISSSHKIRSSGFGMLPCMSASHGRDWKEEEEEKNKSLHLIDSECMENNRCEVKCNKPIIHHFTRSSKTVSEETSATWKDNVQLNFSPCFTSYRYYCQDSIPF
jgi:hypothetical protein